MLAPRLLALGIAAASLTIVPSCTRSQSVTFVVKLPPEVRDQVEWLEIGAYDAATCPSITQLGGGLPRGSLIQRIGFRNGDAAPTFRVPKGSYAFAATARNTQCEVLGAGCTAIDVPGSSEITIGLKAAPVKGGKCSAGSACNNAECVPAPTSDGLGVGCTLEVVGAGPLESLSTDGSNVSLPVISAVADGFVVAYSQIDGTNYRVTTLKIGVDGGPVRADETTSLPFNRYTIPGACPNDADTKGLGLVFDTPTAGNGLLIVPRSPKCSAASMSIFNLLPNGHLAGTQPASPGFQGGAESLVMTNHPISALGYLVYVVNDQAQLQTVTSQGFSGTGVQVGGAPPHERAWVAATRNVVAVLTKAKGVSAPTDDGGAASDAPEMRLEVAVPGSQFAAMPTRNGNFGSIAAQDGRIVFLTSGSLQAPVDAHLFNIGDQAYVDLPITLTEKGDTLAADVAISGNRMYVAVVQSLGISMVAYDNFATQPKEIKQRALSHDFRVKQFMGGTFDLLRDGYVAVAANGARVGLVWMTGSRVSAGEEVGGWAVLACR